jgi:mitochondrial fusion and transport protein UGO1
MLSSTLQPLLHHAIQSTFFPSTPDFETPMFLPVISHMLTAVLLSPVDLVRTRLIVQSSMERYRTYSGPIDALRQILAQEGGWRGVYLHPHLLYPAVLESGFRAVASLWVPYLVGTEAGTRMGLLGELVLSCVASVVTLPIELVRRRLQVQRRGVGKLRTCVETRPGGYEGMIDCAWKTIQEEKQGLYRGLSVRAGASLIVFFLGFLGMDGSSHSEGRGSHGWAEL